MSFFRDYLVEHNEEPDFRFQERDESWFVFDLLLIRLGLVTTDWPRTYFAPFRRFPWLPYAPTAPRLVPDPLRELQLGPETEQALHFVTIFLCFFVPKPPSYRNEIATFKEFFIPNFAVERNKQRLLFQSVRPSFFKLPLAEVVRDWRFESIYEFINPENRSRWQGGFGERNR